MVLHQTTIGVDKREGLPMYRITESYAKEQTNHIVLFLIFYLGSNAIIITRRRFFGVEIGIEGSFLKKVLLGPLTLALIWVFYIVLSDLFINRYA